MGALIFWLAIGLAGVAWLATAAACAAALLLIREIYNITIR